MLSILCNFLIKNLSEIVQEYCVLWPNGYSTYKLNNEYDSLNTGDLMLTHGQVVYTNRYSAFNIDNTRSLVYTDGSNNFVMTSIIDNSVLYKQESDKIVMPVLYSDNLFIDCESGHVFKLQDPTKTILDKVQITECDASFFGSEIFFYNAKTNQAQFLNIFEIKPFNDGALMGFYVTNPYWLPPVQLQWPYIFVHEYMRGITVVINLETNESMEPLLGNLDKKSYIGVAASYNGLLILHLKRTKPDLIETNKNNNKNCIYVYDIATMCANLKNKEYTMPIDVYETQSFCREQNTNCTILFKAFDSVLGKFIVKHCKNNLLNSVHITNY